MSTLRSKSGPLCLFVSVTLCSCDSDRPSLPSRVGQRPDLTVTALEILGGESVEPGQSIQLVASATYSDGSTRNVTGEAAWSASTLFCGSCPKPTNQTLSIQAPGIVAALQRGEGAVTARLGAHEATTGIIVVPAGTFRLTGVVTYVGSANLPIPGVYVRVKSGTGKGQWAVTGDDGRYRLYGLAGPTTLELSLLSYVPKEVSVFIEAHEGRDFEGFSPDSGAGYWDYATGR